MRPKDQKRVVTEKIIRYGSPEQGAFHTVQRQTRKHRGGQEAEGEGNGRELLLWLPWEGTDEVG